MILLECLCILIAALCCYAAPASDSEKPPNHCGQPPRPDNTELTGTWNEEYYPPGKKASYTCSPGHVRSGLINYVCTDGKWEGLGKIGQCRRRSCGHPGEIDFGSFELKNEEQFVFGAIVEYTCDEGYRMVSRHKTRECTATGWTNRPPICEVKQCPPIVVNDDVNVLYTSQDEEHTVGQVVRFECNVADLTLNGPSEIFCTSEGQWNENPPSCKEISCDQPKIDHGKPKKGSADRFKAKQTIDYECNEGYKPTRTPQATCTAGGWSPTPMCDEINCNLEYVANGKVERPKQTYRYGETARLTCNDGYHPQGNSDEPSTCTSNGWRPPLKCVSKQCPRPDIPNGRILHGWFWGHYYKYRSFPADVGSYFYYTCDEGFVPPSRSYYDTSYCRKEGWSPQPRCLKPCPVPSPEEMMADIWVQSHSYFEGDTIQFRCKYGYQTKDGRTEGKLECRDGKFTKEKCYNSCQQPYVKNAVLTTHKTKYEIGAVVTFTCMDGYYITKNIVKGMSECTNSGWKPELQCKEISCLIKDIPFKSGEVVHFKCEIDEELEGHNSSQCYYFGWGPEVPVCKEKYSATETATIVSPQVIKGDTLPGSKCPPPSAPPNADIKYLNSTEDEVEIKCNPRYILDGLATISCRNGKWQSPPMCIEAKECSRPPYIANSEIIEDPGVYNHGSTVKYKCNEGYHMITPDTNTCKNGRWETPPTCEENFCGKPEGIENGNLKTDKEKYKSGERAIYECSKGYKLSTDAAICRRGKWDSIPECIDNTCGRPPKVSNGEVIGIIVDKYFPGDRVAYQCVSSHSFKDNINSVTCENSQWTETPVCRRTGQTCGRPPVVNFGDTKENRKDIYPSGSFVTYICMHYYKLEGNEKVYCRDGEWEKEPVCREPCTAKELDMKLNNIKLKYRDASKLYSQHFDNITFACLPDYEISDKSLLRVQCLDGKLEYPKCFKKGFCKLERPKMDENNIRYSGGDIVENESSITFECAEGMIPENNLEAKCIQKHINYPKCIDSLPCSAPDISHVLISPEKKNYSSGISADVNCQEPYAINGPRSITCNKGQWSELPECLSPCAISVESLNEKNLEIESKEDLTKTYKHSEEVKVKCKENFKRPRHPTVTCNNGRMKYDKCFSGGVCRIDQDKLVLLDLDERHDNEVYYGKNETVYFKCKDGSKTLTGTCAKDQKSQNLQLTYPDCSTPAAAAAAAAS